MTDRGLPVVDGAPACPFVAFADDRDERATSPDHRHRCYAEERPAPRALAHQEAYCLASAFPVCPTFQDWARREAARARPSPAETPGESTVARPGPVPADDRGAAGRAAGGGSTVGLGAVALGGAGVGAGARTAGAGSEDVSAPGFLASRDRAGGGLAGSAADRLASEAGGSERDRARDDSAAMSGAGLVAGLGAARLSEESSPGAARRDPGEWLDDEVERQDASWPDRRQQPAVGRPRREPNVHQDWDRPRRESHATRRTALQLPRPTGIWIAAGLIAIAALLLFLLPGFLRGLGSGGPDSSGVAAGSPSPTAAASPSASPSPAATPAPSLYVVQEGDTLSGIAQRLGVPLQVLIAANAERLPDPNNLQIGDELIIPPAGTTPAPSGAAPGAASGSPAP